MAVAVAVATERKAMIPNEEDPLGEEMYWCESSSVLEDEDEMMEKEELVRDGREESGRVKVSTFNRGEVGRENGSCVS